MKLVERCFDYLKLFSNIAISFIGAGILGLPYAFKTAGIIQASVIIILVAALSVIGMLKLIDIKYFLLTERKSSPSKSPMKERETSNGGREELAGSDITFRELGEEAFGLFGLLTVEFAIVLSQIGFCCAYLIFISKTLVQIHPQHTQYEYLVPIIIPLFLLVSLRKLSMLGIFSFCADVVTLLAHSIVIAIDIVYIVKLNHQNIPTLFNADSLPFIFSVSIYCYEGAGLIFSLESSPSKQIHSHFRLVFVITITIITAGYIVFGVLGYLAFSDETHDIITSNISNGVLSLIIKIFLSFSLFFTFPVMMFPVSGIMERRMSIADTYTWHNIILRITLVIVTCMIVILIPNFATIMELVGATLCTLLNFILPGLFYIAIVGYKKGIIRVVIAEILILFGILSMIMGTYDVFKRMMQGEL